MIAALSALRRSWWFPNLDGLRPSALFETYHEFDLDTQPRLDNPDAQFSWLEAQAEHDEWTIDNSDATPQRRLGTDELASIASAQLSVPVALRTLASRPELQRKIRSATGCYLDLGDTLARTTADGFLLHFLSDQQWVRHWLAYIDRKGGETVLSTVEPVGFVLPDDWETPLPAIIPLDGSFDLQICADSVAEFFERFWVENELFYYLTGTRPLTEAISSYAAQLRAASQ